MLRAVFNECAIKKSKINKCGCCRQVQIVSENRNECAKKNGFCRHALAKQVRMEHLANKCPRRHKVNSWVPSVIPLVEFGELSSIMKGEPTFLGPKSRFPELNGRQDPK